MRDAISEWREHIPFAGQLVAAIRPRVFVELGVFTGVSYCAFCEAIQAHDVPCSCYGIDHWRGDNQCGYYGPDVLAELRAYHDARYSTFSRLVERSFDEALEMFDDGVVDLLHLDGYHTYEAVAHDVASWLPKMRRGGVMVLHDIAERRPDFGVWQVWEALKARYPIYREFAHGHGLGIVVVW